MYSCSYIHVLLLSTSSANIIMLRDCVQPLHIAGAGPTLVVGGLSISADLQSWRLRRYICL